MDFYTDVLLDSPAFVRLGAEDVSDAEPLWLGLHPFVGISLRTTLGTMTETEGPHWIIRLIREEEVWWYGGNATLTSRTLSTREVGAFRFDNRVDAERQAQSFRNQGVADKVEVVEVT